MTVYPSSNANPANAMPVWIAPAVAGSGALNSFTNITTAASTLVKTGPGVFLGLTVNTGGAGSTATVYDGTSAGGTKIGTFATAAQGSVNAPLGGISFATGLFVVTASGTPADITVVFQ